MQDLLELLVSIKTTGIDQLNKVEGSLKQVSAGAQSGDKDFAKFQSRIADFTKSGLSLRDSLQALANESNGFGASLRKMAVDALAADKDFAAFQSNAQKLADKTKKDADAKIASDKRKADSAKAQAEAEERATERIIATLERRAAAIAASTRVQRLEQERSYALLGARNPVQAGRVNSAYDSFVQSELKRQEDQAKQRAERAAINEANAAERAAASEMNALSRLGTMGSAYAGGIPMFAGRQAFTAGLAGPLVGLAAGALAISTVHSAAQESRETVNSANRLDLSVSQTRDLKNESRLAGVNFGSLENASRTLSAALEDSTGSGKKAADALSKLGIDTVTSTGEVREMGPVLLDVIDKLSDLPSKTERAAEGNRILGRGYKELEPLIEKHHELQAELSKYGLIIDANLISKLSEAETQFSAAGIAFDNFKAKLAGKLEPVVISLVTTGTSVLGGSMFNGPKNPYPGWDGKGDPRQWMKDHRPASVPMIVESPAITNPARDAFGRFLNNQGDSEEKLRKNVEDAKKTYLDSLNQGKLVDQSRGAESAAFAKSTAEITKNKAAYDGLNASLKALEGSKGNVKFVRDLIDELNGKSEDPITKLFSSVADKTAAHPYLTSGQRGGINDATLNNANQLLADARDKQDEEQERTNTHFVKAGGQYDRNAARLWKDEITKGLERHDKSVIEDVKKGDKSSEEIARIRQQSDRDQTSAQSSRVLRNIDLNAGPGTGGQKRAADEAYAYRLSQAEQFQQKELNNLTDITTKRVDSARIEAEYKKLVWQAEDEHETKLLELQHKRQEEAQQLAGKLFDSLQKPGGFTQLVKSELNGTARQIFENVTSPIIGGIGKSISGSAPQGGQWSQVFKGTILDGSGGKDTPVVAAQDRTTAAVDLVRQTIEATATGKPLPGTGQPTVSGGGGSTPGVGVVPGVTGAPGTSSSSSPLSGLTAWLGLAGLSAASINTIVNPPGFPGKKEIDSSGGITNPTTVNHGYSDSAHTGAASRILSGSVGLTGALIGAGSRLGFGRQPVYVDASGNVVGSGEAGTETYGTPSDGSFGDFGGETNESPYQSGSGETPYEGSGYPTFGSNGDYGGEVTPGRSAAVVGGPTSGNVAPSASTASNAGPGPGIMSALAMGAKGGPSASNFLGNLADTVSNGGAASAAATVGSGLALGGAVATGVYTAFQQFKSGGASGALGGVGAILGTAAAVDPEPISKAVLGAAALVTGIVKAFIPDQKTLRAQQESEALTQNAYLAPPTINSTQSVSGNVLGYDKYGMPVSQGAFGGFGVTQSYQVKDPYTGNYQTVPGSVSTTTISPGTATPGAAASANSGSTGSAAPQIHVHVSAMDSQSVMQRAPDIAAAVNSEIQKGGAISFSIQRAVLGS